MLRAGRRQALNGGPSPKSSPIFRSVSAVPDGHNEFDPGCTTHSIELVTGPIGMVRWLLNCLQKNGVLYFEVSNPMVDRKLPQLPELSPSHTIFYTPAFFEELPLRKVRLGTFDYRVDMDGVWMNNGHGADTLLIGAR